VTNLPLLTYSALADFLSEGKCGDQREVVKGFGGARRESEVGCYDDFLVKIN